MKCIAVYSLKGGVGKTTLAVSLAWAAAMRSSRTTLVWDLDPQAGATFLLDTEPRGSREAKAVFQRDRDPAVLIRTTGTERLSLLPADKSLRSLDHYLHELGKKKRLSKLLTDLGGSFERIILDCPPGLTPTSEQVLRAADLVLVPLIPSPLSRRALDEVIDHLDRKRTRIRILPVYTMVDRRRSAHIAALGDGPDWPMVPMSSLFERMSIERRPVGEIEPRSIAAQAVTALWERVERLLAAR